ncbi:MAG: hypothetical protein ACI8UO_002695 [Verrucomicrobiales bacterium]|jgi:hypothetical protein
MTNGAENSDLGQLQAWMQSAISQPAGIEAAESIETRITRSKALSSAERLGIYRYAYHARLLENFRAEFPALLHALGAPSFEAFIKAYLREHPPRSYTLCELGDRFPDFLSRTRPSNEAWPDFLIDLARLERAVFENHDGPGTESQQLPNADSVLGVDSASFSSARFETVCNLRFFLFRYPAGEFVRAVRRGEEPDFPGSKPTEVAIHRSEYRVRIFDLEIGQVALLDALAKGKSIAETGFEIPIARRAVLRWLDEGFFTSVRFS